MQDLFFNLSSDDFNIRCKAYQKLSIYDTERATNSQAHAVYFYTTCHDINLFIKEAVKSNCDLAEKIKQNPGSPGKFISHIDQFLKNGKKTTHPLKLYKGVIHKDLDRLFAPLQKSISLENFQEFINITYLEPAYLSTTISRSYAIQAISNNRTFYNEKNSTHPDALLTIEIPIGTRICAVDNMATRLSAQVTPQYEILFPRNQKLLIRSIRKSDLNSDKCLLIDVILQKN